MKGVSRAETMVRLPQLTAHHVRVQLDSQELTALLALPASLEMTAQLNAQVEVQ